MKTNFQGCAVCGSTWGDYWGEIDGERMFFCCKICYLELRNLVLKIKQSTGWVKIDELNIKGSYAGRNCLARAGEKSASFLVTFDSLGEVQTFNKLPK